MKRAALAVVMLIVAAIHATTTPALVIGTATLVAGCQSAPDIQGVVTASKAYNEVVGVLIAYRRAGQMSDEQYRTVDPYIRLGAAALDGLEQAVIDHDEAQWVHYRDALDSVIDELLRAQIEIEHAGGNTAVVPPPGNPNPPPTPGG